MHIRAQRLIFVWDFGNLGVAVKAFQIVIGTLFFGEDVDDVIAVIHQHPFTLAVAFDVAWAVANRLLEMIFYFITNRHILACVGAVGDNKIIGEGGYFAQIKYANVPTLLCLYRFDDFVPGWRSFLFDFRLVYFFNDFNRLNSFGNLTGDLLCGGGLGGDFLRGLLGGGFLNSYGIRSPIRYRTTVEAY